MRFDPILDRLRPVLNDHGVQQLGGLGTIAGADMAQCRLPGLFVVPGRESAQANRLASGVNQRVSVDFVVLLAMDASCATDLDDSLHTLTSAIIERLTGFTPDGMAQPIAYRGARLAALEPGLILWGVTFATAYHLRNVTP